MTRVLLVKPYQPSVCTARCPPLGILYLASELREALGSRLSIEALDARLYGMSPEQVACVAADADIVGISAENLEARATHEIARLLKAIDPQKRVVIGGPYAHYRALEVMEAGPEVDWVFDGEADRAFPEAVRRHLDGEPFDGLAGMYFRRGTEVVEPPGLDTIADLDALPFPAWDLADLDAYENHESFTVWRGRRRYATLFTSRGCPYKCAYCHDIFGKKFRWRSAENVVDEIRLLKDTYGVEEFQIIDDIFNLHKPRLRKIFAMLEERYEPGELAFCFPNGLRGDILKKDVIQTLKKGGTYSITVAVETVTDRLQKLIQKDLDVPKVGDFIRYAHEEGILVKAFFMLGFPTESRREMWNTFKFAWRSPLTFANFFSVIPQPATPLYELAKRENPEALAKVCQDDYLTGKSWYELAYGFPLRVALTLASGLFYLAAPWRVWRILRRIPLWNCTFMLNGLGGPLFSRVRRRFAPHRPQRWEAPPASATGRTIGSTAKSPAARDHPAPIDLGVGDRPLL
jgi:anaerobic magnesium-protoporphyrin IX monomethyl ester cyclase